MRYQKELKRYEELEEFKIF